MESMDWHKVVANQAVLKEAKTVLVACSGGLDSVVLAHLLSQEKIPLVLVHVNYHLRGEDSNLDEQFVRNLAKELECPIHIKQVELSQILEEQGGNLQETARVIRYEFFESLLDQHPDSILCTAHHANDQVETFFMRILRQSGIAGLSGIPQFRNRLFRPLLNIEKTQLKEYAKRHSIQWREDVSNQKNNYLRNLLRNDWLPQMETNGVAGEMSLTEAVQTLTQAFANTKKIHLKKIGPLVKHMKSHGRIGYNDFFALSADEQHLLLDEMGWSHDLVESILSLKEKERSKKISIDSTYFLYREQAELVLVSEREINMPTIQIATVSELPTRFDKHSVYLDQLKLKGKLSLRPWKTGDRIQPVGMSGSQLVSDILKDAKVPLYEKKNCLVLVDDETVLWVVNHKVGRTKIAQPGSQSIIQVTLDQHDN